MGGGRGSAAARRCVACMDRSLNTWPMRLPDDGAALDGLDGTLTTHQMYVVTAGPDELALPGARADADPALGRGQLLFADSAVGTRMGGGRGRAPCGWKRQMGKSRRCGRARRWGSRCAGWTSRGPVALAYVAHAFPRSDRLSRPYHRERADHLRRKGGSGRSPQFQSVIPRASTTLREQPDREHV